MNNYLKILLSCTLFVSTHASCNVISKRIYLKKDLDQYHILDDYYHLFCTCYYPSFEYTPQPNIVNEDEAYYDDIPQDTTFYQELSSFLINQRCKALSITSAKIVIEPNFFPNCYNQDRCILQIFLNHTNLEVLKAGGFNGLHKLQELHLQDNNIKTISEGVFIPLISLKVLNLERNELNYISNNTFVGLSNLTHLYLNENNITILPKGLFKPLRTLIFLDISENPFQKIDHVDITLQQLNSRKIGLTNIFSRNYSLFSDYEYHDKLLLTDNKNLILKLRCHALIKLDLSQNKITYLNHTLFKNSFMLRHLDFSNNLINQTESDAFTNLHSLTVLHLNNNKLSQIPHGIFHDLSSLEYLDLSQNQLKSLSYGFFENMLTMKKLNLSYNMLSQFNLHRSSSSSSSVQLMELYLDNNKLENLNLESLNKIEKISLDKNLWNCKNLASIVSYLEKNGIVIIYGTTHQKQNIHRIACDDTKFINIDDVKEKKIFNVTDSDKYIKQLFLNFNNEFEHSKFSKFFKNDFEKSRFYKFFDDFNLTNFYKYVENEKVLTTNLTNVNNIDSATFERIVSNFNGNQKQIFEVNNIQVVLYMITIALYGIICILIVFLYVHIGKKKYKYSIAQRESQVELM